MVERKWKPLVGGCDFVGQKQGYGVGEWQRQRRVRTKCEILALHTFFPAFALVKGPLKYHVVRRRRRPGQWQAAAAAPQPPA